MSRVTLDSNIYVSAFEFGGGPMRLLHMGLDGEIEIAVSQPIIDETMRVLREKFGWSDAEVRDALLVMETCSRKVAPTQTLDVVRDDPDDNRILECAQTADSDWVITGDKDLLRLSSHGRARIVKTAEFLAHRGGR